MAAGSADGRCTRAQHARGGLGPGQVQLRGDVDLVGGTAVRAVQGGVDEQLYRSIRQVALAHVAACTSESAVYEVASSFTYIPPLHRSLGQVALAHVAACGSSGAVSPYLREYYVLYYVYSPRARLLVCPNAQLEHMERKAVLCKTAGSLLSVPLPS